MFHGGWFDSSQGAAVRKVIANDRIRILLVTLLIASASSVTRLPAVLVLTVPIVALIGWSGMRLRYVGLRLLLIVPFGLAAVLLLSWSRPEGAERALFLAAKLAAANLGVTFLLGTTPAHDLLKALKALRVPPAMVEIIGFTLRYLSVLSEEIHALILSQKSRGMRMASFTSFRTYKRLGQLLGVLLIRSVERSLRIHQAMLARGYDAHANASVPRPEKERGILHERHRSTQPVVPVSRFDRSAEKRLV